MATNNLMLFDQNKSNMLTDAEYLASQQRLGGVQAGIASSTLQNKMGYQLSLVAYAIGQLMVQNGLDALDSLTAVAFVNNLSSSVLQKVIDKATTAQAQAATDSTKWMTPALVKSYFDFVVATQAEAQAGTINTKWMSPLRVANYFVSQKATAAEAIAGINNTHWMTPSLVKSAVGAFGERKWNNIEKYITAGSFVFTVPAGVTSIGAFMISGGQGGGARLRWYNGVGYESADGGCSGGTKVLLLNVTPGQQINLVVGAAGIGARCSIVDQGDTYKGRHGLGSFGGASSFGNITCPTIGQSSFSPSRFDTYGTDKYFPKSLGYDSSFFDTNSSYLLSFLALVSNPDKGVSSEFVNPFDETFIFGYAGGSSGHGKANPETNDLIGNLVAGGSWNYEASADYTIRRVGSTAKSYGAGGGSCSLHVNENRNTSSDIYKDCAKGGDGATGAILIYAPV